MLKRLILCALISQIIHANAQEVKESRSQGNRKEGIKVHGHWTIEVRDPDGKLVLHREFENSLEPGGADALVNVFGRNQVPGLWTIGLVNINNAAPCPSFGCSLYEPNSSIPADSSHFKTLSVLVSNQGQLLLSGTFAASQTGSITGVNAFSLRCPATVLPANCNESSAVNGYLPFTTSLINVNVSAGQVVQVTVAFSFS
jgi:hypothetical protein